MQIIYNCFAGISGDMNLAAMLDLGMNQELLKSELSKLNLDKEFDLRIYPADKHGIHGTQVRVELKHQHDHHHTHNHSHSRNYANIKQHIESTSLHNDIKELAIKIFWEVAIAEGKVHNKPPEEVHFHEVGATDSIVDIVGAAICYHHLSIDHVTSTSPELGGGFVICQHGKIPVPAPATAEILKGIACTTGAVNKEMTTPTGAAILKVLTDNFDNNPKLDINKTAYGIGHRDVEIPNVLRVYESNTSDSKTTKAIMIECNIDDMTAEDLAIIPELLIANGASDAYLTPIIMKKGRSAHTLSALCQTKNADTISQLILKHTTTIGLRQYEVLKTELPRKQIKVNTPLGEICYKECTLSDGSTKKKIEFENILTLAKQNNISISEVRNTINI